MPDFTPAIAAMRMAGYLESAQLLRSALTETPGLTPLEAIELLERAAAEQEAISQR